jgi:hypothetical protein
MKVGQLISELCRTSDRNTVSVEGEMIVVRDEQGRFLGSVDCDSSATQGDFQTPEEE